MRRYQSLLIAVLCLLCFLHGHVGPAFGRDSFGVWVDEMRAWCHTQNLKGSLETLGKIFRDDHPELAVKFKSTFSAMTVAARGGATVQESMQNLFGTDLAGMDTAAVTDIMGAAEKYYKKPPQGYYLALGYVNQDGIIQGLESKMSNYLIKDYSTPKILPGYGGRQLPGAPFKPHTVHNMRPYIDERLTAKLIDDVCTKGVNVEVHTNSIVAETFKSLRERGYDHVYYILRGYYCSPVILMAGNPQTGDYRYVITYLLGDDRLIYVLYQLLLAEHDGQKMDESQLSVVEHHPEIDRSQLFQNLYRTVLEATDANPDHILIGWDAIMGDALQKRYSLRKKHEALVARLGDNPVQGLADALRSEGAPEDLVAKIEKQASLTMGRLLTTSSKELWRNSKACNYLTKFEKKVKSWVKKAPDAKIFQEIWAGSELTGGVAFDELRSKWSSRTPFTGLSSVAYKDSAGKQKVLLTTGFFYGEMAQFFTDACIEAFGPETISYFGTSGGLSNQDVADFNVPHTTVDRLGKRIEIQNAFAPLAKASGQAWFDFGVSVNVSSPLEESNVRVEQLRGYGPGEPVTVEVENVWIARAVAKAPGIKLFMASGVSDIPGDKEEDITHINDNALRVRNRVRGEILDRMMGPEGWDIVDLVLRPKPAKKAGFFVQVGGVYNKNCSDGPDSSTLTFSIPDKLTPPPEPDPQYDDDGTQPKPKERVGKRVKNWFKLHFSKTARND